MGGGINRTRTGGKEKMKIYHTTKKETAEKIRKEGFSLDFAGTVGGLQMGRGVYFCSDLADNEYWAHRLDIRGETMECSIDDALIIKAKNVKKAEMITAAEKRGWFSGGNITDKAKTDLGIEIENFDAQVKSAAAKDAGFAGIVFGYGENIVIWDLAQIKIK
jgi:hypothetical protein